MKTSHPAQAMRRQQGFTLLEVMLAFVVLAVALGLLVGMLSNGLRQVQQAQGETEATLHAQSLLDQLGKLEPILPGRSDGEFDHGRYRYQLDIQKTDDPAAAPATDEAEQAQPASVPGPDLYRISLAVSWGAAGPGQQLRFTTLRARTPAAVGGP